MKYLKFDIHQHSFLILQARNSMVMHAGMSTMHYNLRIYCFFSIEITILIAPFCQFDLHL